MITYKTENDNNYLILPATLKEGFVKTGSCPFCGVNHVHSPEQGHRVAHCNPSKSKPVVASDGTGLSADDGYFIKIIK